ncbi:hypothetical protein C4D60_Mb03t06460 [Musa balbisiana]|uniref:Epidermal patterning factor-like protein n=1 Tax=Musa balbisiana TaxID=52838 RepID=A0A4S8J915_MUSBA|nr:hypothetical protein C4D60_Mb03t06460 [Musa balbisiana]
MQTNTWSSQEANDQNSGFCTGDARTFLPFVPEEMLVEDKIRLGSTPPSCHNRCDLCNPCTAVQVPTLPVQSTPVRSRVRKVRPSDDPFSYSNQYSNYKPLGWKCSCGNRLYNP